MSELLRRHRINMKLTRRVLKKTSGTDTITEYLKDHHSYQILNCKECGRIVEDLSSDVGAVTCDRCVQRMVAPPEFIVSKKPTEENPRGWHLRKQYTSPLGKKYEYGKEVSTEVPKNANIRTDTICVGEVPKKPRGRPKKIQ